MLKDNLGRQVGLFDNGRLDSMAVSGFDMMAGIDLELQQYGEELMRNKRGAIVAIEPSTGEILAMVSAPSYDPNSIALDKTAVWLLIACFRIPLTAPFSTEVS